MTDFEYEIAFSFLAEDETLAREICDLASPRVSTFIYSEHQLEIAGTDGIETFSNVFGRDSRTVAILWRARWGSTKFTKVEETAIKNRVFHNGADFATLVALEQPVTPPLWFPQSRIWADFRLLGVAGVAGALLERVRANGATVREETAEENAARLQRELEAHVAVRRFRDSDAGVQAATAAFHDFERELRRLAGLTGIAVLEPRGPGQPISLRRDEYGLLPIWAPQFTNTLDDATLSVRYFRGTQIAERQFEFHVLSRSDMAWRERHGNRRMYSSEKLADESIIHLLNYVRAARLKE